MSSGVYGKTFGESCRAALRDAGIVAVEMPIQPAHFALAQTAGNDVLAHWQAQGIHLWSETEALLPLNPSQTEYSLGVGGDHCFTDYEYTTASAAIAALATVIPCTSTTGMTVGDFIGVELASGSRHWSTISSISAGVSVTIAVGIVTAASIDASIYTYTTKIDRPVRILDVRFATTQLNDELIVSQESRQRYYQTPNKTSTSSNVSCWYYSPQLNNGKLSVWSPVVTCVPLLRFTFVKPQYVNSDQSEQVLIPSEWYLPFKWAIASELAVTYGIDPNRLVAIAQKAETTLQQALSNDAEIEYFSIQPG
jgi:hypothetical protein